MSKIPNILMIYTGGTIGMIRDYKSGALRSFDFSHLKSKIPELNLLDCHIENISFDTPIDSSDMNSENWVQIVEIIEENYNDFDGFVVLTGTDTMSYTASAISFMLEYLQKPVVFTGSQLPIGDLRTDAKENLITATQIATLQENGKPKISEVCLYFEYKLYRANRTTKISSEQFEAFDSPNYPSLAESGVHLNIKKESLYKPQKNENELIVRKNINANVVILKLFPGITRQIVEHILNIPELQGVILESYGSGNAPTEDWFIDLLDKTLKKEIPVVNVTQCIIGKVTMGYYDTSVRLLDIGIISGKDITTESAIAKMKYLIGEGVSFEDFRKYFEIPLRGEMSS
jgi:L-asparaginase